MRAVRRRRELRAVSATEVAREAGERPAIILERGRPDAGPRRRYPLEPLLRLITPLWASSGDEHRQGALAGVLGIDRTTVYRWNRLGVPECHADRVAIALGRHPGSVWPEWWAHADDDGLWED